MNGYKLSADSYRALLADGTIDRANAEKNIKVLDFLATCDSEEIQELFNSSAFNEIVKGYLKMAIANLDLGEKIDHALLRELGYLFDTVPAKQAEEYYNNH